MIKLFKYLKKIDYLFLIFVICLVVAQVYLDLKMPDYTSEITQLISKEQVSPGSINMHDIWYNARHMLYCAGLSMACAMLCGFFTSRIAANFAKSLRVEIFKKVTSFSNTEMNKFSTPSLITRTTNDVVQMQNFMAMGVQILIKAPVLAIWAICKISSKSSSWTIATAIAVVFIVLCVGIIVFVTYPKFKQIQKLTDDLNDITRENISGVRVIRAFNAEDYQTKKFESTNDKVLKNNLFTSRSMGLMMPVMTICMNMLTLSIYWIGAYLINDAALADRVSILGDMTAYTSYALQVVMAFMMLIVIFVILPRTIVSGGRIYEVLNTDLSIKDGNITNTDSSEGTIEFKDVSFAYGDSDKMAISNISFKVNKGETLAIIGATGCGKSSIVNLIPRFYDVSSGEILVDGVNVKDYKEEVLRNKISIATQKAVLFKGDIKSNITYGAENIDENKMIESLKLAEANFVFDLEDGLNSLVAQGGTNFSGGQKQRLSIARSLYKDAEVLIFDDTFSALDYKTDMLVRKNIKENLNDKTVIIVAQRIGTIKNADNILVIDDGKIIARGKHEELLKTCDIYKEIALSQLSKEEL